MREVISSEMWEQVNRYYLTVSNGAARRRPILDPYQFFNEVKLLAQQVSGVSDNTMSHDQAWHFFQLGRLLERADNTSRLLDVKYFLLLPSVEDVGGPVDEMQWSILLRQPRRSRCKALRRIDRTTSQVLLLDREFRAILLRDARGSLRHFRRTTGASAMRNSAWVWCARVGIRTGVTHSCGRLHLDGLQTKLNAMGSAINDTYFALRTAKAGGISSDVLSGYQSQRGAGRNR